MLTQLLLMIEPNKDPVGVISNLVTQKGPIHPHSAPILLSCKTKTDALLGYFCKIHRPVLFSPNRGKHSSYTLAHTHPWPCSHTHLLPLHIQAHRTHTVHTEPARVHTCTHTCRTYHLLTPACRKGRHCFSVLGTHTTQARETSFSFH